MLGKFCTAALSIFKIISITSDNSIFIIPSPQKLLITENPFPFHLHLHMRERSKVTAKKVWTVRKVYKRFQSYSGKILGADFCTMSCCTVTMKEPKVYFWICRRFLRGSVTLDRHCSEIYIAVTVFYVSAQFLSIWNIQLSFLLLLIYYKIQTLFWNW